MFIPLRPSKDADAATAVVKAKDLHEKWSKMMAEVRITMKRIQFM